MHAGLTLLVLEQYLHPSDIDALQEACWSKTIRDNSGQRMGTVAWLVRQTTFGAYFPECRRTISSFRRTRKS
jgi:hypothetical protein